ncbi:hypothetical protein MRB53_018051 [Persea americana]|uniref:Uncharacterized protein n=1 Tax=Persea americana TaxID=3435 RepID=A0ACC2M871_PERAE|nr:hypothetical protein MRB53_018051 [Persea americana]
MARPPSIISLRLLSSLLLLPTSHSSPSLLSFSHPIAFNSSFSFLRNPFIPSELRYFGRLSLTERNKGTKWSGRAPNQLRQFNLSPEIVEATLSHCPSDTIALSFFLWCGRQPDYFHCSTSFLQMIPVVGRLTDKFESAGFPLQAVDFYNDMVDRGFTPDNYSYAGLLNGLCRAGRIDDAVNVYHGIIINSSDLDPHVHTIVFDGLIKAGETHRAIRLFRKAIAENHSLDVISYTVAICGLFRGDRLGEACSLFSQMKEAGFFPNIFTYNIMLCGLCKARDIGMVSKLLKDMVDAGVELDCISFNILVGLLYKLNRFSSAFKLFIEMFNLGLKPNKATHALLAKGLYHAGKDSADLEAKIEKCHGV